MTKHFTLLIILCLLCISISAQEAADSLHQLDEVEVVARGNGDGQSLSPQYSFSADDFRRLNVSDITSALRRLPGVTLRDYGGAGGLKTVSVRGFGSGHVGVLLDGLLLSDSPSGQVDFRQFALAEVSGLRLNVLGTPSIWQPARNTGRAALVAVESEAGLGDTGTEPRPLSGALALTAGSWRDREADGLLRWHARRTTASLAAGILSAENDYPFTISNGTASHRERRQNSRSEQAYAHAAFSWRMADEATLASFARFASAHRRLPGPVHLYANDNDEGLSEGSLLAQTVLTTRLAEGWHLKAAVRYTLADQRYHNGHPTGGIRSERYTQREAYATAALLWTPAPGWQVDCSADVFHIGMSTTLAANPHPRRNAFLQSLAARWQGRRVELTATLLNSAIDSERRLSPTVEAAWRLGPALSLRVAAKEAFRMPSMTELYYFRIGQNPLRPEVTRQLNAGAALACQWPCGSLALTLDGYLGQTRNRIVCLPFNMFVARYTNLSRTMNRGLDLAASASFDISRHTLAVGANWSVQRVGMRGVQRPWHDYQTAYTPLHSGSASVSWQSPWATLSATLTAASSQWISNEHNGSPLPAWHEVALGLGHTFRLGSQSLAAQLTVQNLTDRSYCLVANYPMPERNLKLNLKYRF